MTELVKLSPEEISELRARLLKEQMEEEDDRVVFDHSGYDETNVTISADEMSAFLYLAAPRDHDRDYTKEDIVRILRSNKVMVGYRTTAIAEIVEKKLFNQSVLVAEGKEAIQGQDGYYDFFFDISDKRKPLIRPDGTADYTNMGALENVNEGDVIARYHSAIKGKSGFSVTGSEFKITPSKELPPLRGRSIKRNMETDEYTAEISGKISYSGYKVEILKVHEIIGDVDMIIGKIEFYGDVVISGNVEAGVTIRAGRNIFIGGAVEAATLLAGGDIVLAKGIRGGEKAKVSARGNVVADFIEYSSVDAGMDVQANSIINSKISAQGKVVLAGKRGNVIGGYTHGLRGIVAVKSGNLVEVRTVLHAGFEEEDFVNYAKLLRKESEVKKELGKAVDRMTEMLREKVMIGNRVPEFWELELESLKKTKDICFQVLDEIKQSKIVLSKIMENSRDANISIAGQIYRGTVISIETAKIILNKNDSFKIYQCRNGVIIDRVMVL